MSLHISLCWAEASWLVLLLVSNWVSGVFFLGLRLSPLQIILILTLSNLTWQGMLEMIKTKLSESATVFEISILLLN